MDQQVSKHYNFKKSNSILLIVLSIVMVVFSLWLLLFGIGEVNEGANFRLFKIIQGDIAGLVTLLFGVIILMIGIKRLLQRKFGLDIEPNGFTYHSGAINLGLIEWNQVQEIRTIKIKSNLCIAIDLKNPEIFLNKLSGFNRFFANDQKKSHGTFVIIASKYLEGTHKEIENSLMMGWKAQNA